MRTPLFPWRSSALAVAVLATAMLGGCASAPDAKPDPQEKFLLVFPAPPDQARFYFERVLYSSRDVEPPDEGSLLRSIVTGAGVAAGTGLAKPYGVAARRGKVYVAESVGGGIKVFDLPGKKFSMLDDDSPNRPLGPLGLDVDAEGNVYVVDGAVKAVKVFGADGKHRMNIGTTGSFSRPTGVGVNREITRLYVVDTGGVDKTEEHRVRVYDPRTGRHLFDFGRRGGGGGEFNLPRDVAVAPNGNVYVVDTGNFRVQAFTPDGKFLFTFGQVGRFPGNFSRPREIAIDRQGILYVTDAGFGNMQLFDPNGQLLMFIGISSDRDNPASYMLPAGIAVDEDGRVYIADQFHHKIEVYRPATLAENGGFALGSAVQAPKPAAAPVR